MSTRAAPLRPEARRHAIVEAVTPLFIAAGAGVTTRQMADVAGVAEGTIFSVFPDKNAVILAVLESALDPTPVEEGLAAVDPQAPLEMQLVSAARVIEERSRRIWALGPLFRHLIDSRTPDRPPSAVVESGEAILAALTGLFERHRSRLRVEPARAAAAFRGLMFANGYPTVTGQDRLEVDELVDLLVSGIGAQGC